MYCYHIQRVIEKKQKEMKLMVDFEDYETERYLRMFVVSDLSRC